MKNFSPILIRIIIAGVFIWFGLQQLTDPSSWFGFLPTWVNTLPVSQTDFIYLNGCIELLLGTSLLFGFYARTCALLLGLHLLGITYTIGYGALGVRDFGLAFTAISIAFGPISPFSIDAANVEEPVRMPVTSYIPRPTATFAQQMPVQSQEPVIEHRKII